MKKRALSKVICAVTISSLLSACGGNTEAAAIPEDNAVTESSVQEQQTMDAAEAAEGQAEADSQEKDDDKSAADSQKNADDQTETAEREETADKTASEEASINGSSDAGTDYISLYAPVLKETLEVINEGYDYEKEYRFMSDGLMEKVNYEDKQVLLKDIGYLVEDIDSDGVPELLIGYDDQDYDTLAVQSYILGVYALDEKEPYSVLYGWARNTYRWLGNGHVLNLGSGGAAVTILADSHFDHNEKSFVCDDFYFSDEKEVGDIGYFHNTSGIFDMDQAEELPITSDQFWKIIEGYERECKLLTWTPIGTYAIADEYNEDGTPVHDDSAMYLFADYYRAPTDENWKAFIGKAPKDAVLFIITNPPEELNDLVKAPVTIDKMTDDMVIAVSLADDTKIFLETGEVAFNDAGSMRWDPDPAGKLYKTYLDKGETSCIKITLPEGVPNRCLSISSSAGDGMFLVGTLSGEWSQHSTFITSSSE